VGSQVAPLPPPPLLAVDVVELPTFDELYRAEFAFVWRSLRALGVPEAAVDDAAQEVFLVVHRRLDEFEGRSSLKSWLFGIARGIAANQRRSIRRRREDGELDERVAAAGPGPREQAERSEAVRLVLGFLDRLDEDKRVAMVLVDLEGMTVPEAAELIGDKPNTIYSRLRVARQAFERMVREQREGSDG
jgi:RNA polymerase sigma-70 factor, ECF subfamily